MLKIKKSSKGFSLVELILAVGVFAILASGVTYVVTNSYTNFYGGGNKQNVAEFAQEGIEAVRSIRDNSWQDIEDVAGAGAKGLDKSQGYWEFSGSSDTRDGLTRTVSIANAQRDSNGDIVDSGGSDDTRTKKVTVSVSDGGVAKMEDYVLVTYLTDWSHKVWQQTDWSGVGDSEFWSSSDKASSTSNIATSTAGEITLTQSAGAPASTYGDWANLTSDASVDVGDVTYDLKISTSTNMIYVAGDYGTDKFKAYDTSSARSGTISLDWSADLSSFTYGGGCIALHPNGDYAYVGHRFYGGGKGDEVMAIVELGDDHTVTYAAQATFAFTCNNIVIDDTGDYVYVLLDQGQIVVYQTGSSGLTLTIQGSAQQITDSTTYAMSAGVYDADTTDLYVTMENNTRLGAHTLKKIDTTTKSALSVDYGIAEGSNYMMGIAALDDSSGGNNRFIVSTTNSSADVKTYEDSGSAFSLLDSYNTTGDSEKGIVFDGDHNAVYIDYGAQLFVIDVTNPRQLTSPLEDTSTYADTPYSRPIHFIEYDSNLGGIFILEKTATPVDYLHFIMRPTGASDPDWQEVEWDADVEAGGGIAHFDVVSDGTEAWVCGDTTQDVRKYDISGVEDDPGTLTEEVTVDLGSMTGCRVIAINSDDTYAYLGTVFTLDGNYAIGILNLSTETLTGYGSGALASVGMNLGFSGMMIDSNDAYLYGLSNNSGGKGDLFVWAITDSGATLTLQGAAQQISDGNINDLWVDTTNDLLYVVGDSNTDTFARYDISTKSAASEDYNDSAGDYVQIEYLENVGGKNRFAILAEDIAYDIRIVEDNTTSLTELDTLADNDLGTPHGLAYDTIKDYIFAIGYDGDLISVDISDREAIVAGPVKDTSTYGYTPGNSIPYHYLWYNSSSTGLFVLEKEEDASKHFKFINGPDAPASSGYNSAGSLYSSIFDIGSTGQELLEVSVEQDVPSGCDLTISLEASNDITFSSGLNTQVFSDHTDGYFTSSTQSSLNGNRFLRYLISMDPCSAVEADDSAPTLYDLNIKYR